MTKGLRLCIYFSRFEARVFEIRVFEGGIPITTDLLMAKGLRFCIYKYSFMTKGLRLCIYFWLVAADAAWDMGLAKARGSAGACLKGLSPTEIFPISSITLRIAG